MIEGNKPFQRVLDNVRSLKMPLEQRLKQEGFEKVGQAYIKDGNLHFKLPQGAVQEETTEYIELRVAGNDLYVRK